MAIRPILPYPHAGLPIPCQPVTVFDDAVKTLCTDLLDTMRAAPGVSASPAAHIWCISAGVRAGTVATGRRPRYINPEILSQSRTPCVTLKAASRCLAIPRKWNAQRAVRVRYQEDSRRGIHEEERRGISCHLHPA